jgi:hypothetical protein
MSGSVSTRSVAYVSALKYSSDADLISAVEDQTVVVQDIADNMQKIIDDLEDTQSTASSIGGAATSDFISSTDSSLNSGFNSVGTLSSSVDLSSYSSAASGYIGLLTATVPSMLFWGDNLLFSCLIIFIILSVFLFILRRLT